MNMSRQLRLLGLAVLTVIATGAVAATGAQAGFFTAGAFPATLTGQTVGGPHVLTTELGAMECEPKFHGEQAGVAAEITLTPLYGTSCTIGGKVVHVIPNGCDYRLHAGMTLEADAVAGFMDIKCPAGNRITVEITGMPICRMTIPEQNGIAGITYTNRTMFNDVDIDFNLGGLIYELDMGCPKMGAFANGTYVGTTTLTTDFEGMPVFNAVD
jgi:hypothetical protein